MSAGSEGRASRYMTPRKLAEQLGASGSGTGHYWRMTKSSYALLILVPLFVWTFGPTLGESREAVLAYYAHPWPALIAALTLVVGWMHFKDGVQVAIEDYAGGATRKLLLLVTVFISYAASAAVLFALVRLAL